MNEFDITKKMISTLKEGVEKNKKYTAKPIECVDKPIIRENMLTEWENLKKKTITEESNVEVDEPEYSAPNGSKMVITKSTKQFGDVRETQEDDLVKTIGERIELGEDALVYYIESEDLVLTGKIKSLNVAFQFRYNDPSGNGCYIWANALQMTDKNAKTIGKIKDAFDIWSQKLDEDGDLMDKLKKTASNDK